MMNLWIGDYSHPTSHPPRAADQTSLEDARSRVRDLEHEVGRLKLLNQALWELLKNKFQIPEAELEKRITEVDLRDGVKDGKMTTVSLKCPTCNRVSSSKHWKCLYCGLEFEKPLMG